LFADVSGYTALCEQMAAKGPAGDEYLAKHLNSYFELLVKTVAAQGILLYHPTYHHHPITIAITIIG
jgi:hypothetical protein